MRGIRLRSDVGAVITRPGHVIVFRFRYGGREYEVRVGFVGLYMHSFQGGATLLSLGIIFILYTMFVWWRDVLRESTLEGHHTKVVQLGLRYGFLLFIVSEGMVWGPRFQIRGARIAR
ncbi:hypothetical protein G4B88_022234 [Cannabis sativa]|uniref:Cytochrome c oxidase subunit 3 n=1 Tax=Cannabis sativa TaxID=3483 RepID=A0A7J6FYD5_CANSA|nr:hypothetical protein G4B88_022234 [Cannabis sativa]